MSYTKDELYRYFHTLAPQYLAAAKRKGYVCPICGSGSGQDGTGITTKDGIHFLCWRCGYRGKTLIDILAMKDNTTPMSVFDRLCSDHGYQYIGMENGNPAYDRTDRAISDAELQRRINTPPKQTAAEPAVKTDYSEKYREWHKILIDREKGKPARDYLASRMVSPHWLYRLYNIGFCPNWKHQKAPDNAETTPRIIIPISRYSYLARSIKPCELEKQRQGKMEESFMIYPPSAREFPLIGVVFVVEGEFDFFSMIQAGATAVICIHSIGRKDTFLKLAKEQNNDFTYILALDNDNPGITTQNKLQQEMTDAGLDVFDLNPDTGKPLTSDYLFCGHKDPNEALTNEGDDEEFSRRVRATRMAAEKYRHYKYHDHT